MRVASPKAAPAWINGPSRPSEFALAIAIHDAPARIALRQVGTRTVPSTTASITKPTPPPFFCRRSAYAIAPTSMPPNAGNASRSHHGAASTIATELSPPSALAASASASRKPIANAEAATATTRTASASRSDLRLTSRYLGEIVRAGRGTCGGHSR